MLKRQKLRKIITKTLLNKTIAEGRVYSALPFPTSEEDMPCILVYCTQDGGDTKTAHTPFFNNTATISIEARVADDYKIAEDVSDTLCEQIEALVLGNAEFRAAVDRVASKTTQKGWEDGGQHALTLAIINLQVEYKQEIIEPIQDEFLTARINTDAVDPYDPNLATGSGPDGRIEAVNILNIEQ